MIVSFQNHITGLLDEMTRLVLVNAVYFKGLWQKQFSAANTKPDKFYLNSKENKKIPMMHKKAHFGYLSSDELDAAVLEMPYQASLFLYYICLLKCSDCWIMSQCWASHYILTVV